MVLVEHINIIAEDNKFILFLQTKEGCYYQYIDKDSAQKIIDNINNNANCNSCVLNKDQQAILHSNPEIKGSWEDILPQAKEVYIQKELLDFIPTQEHQEFVENLITREKMYDKSLDIKRKIELLTEAVADERFEDAATIRDEIDRDNG